MFSVNRIKTNTKPDIVQSLGNGVWYYNYDITEYSEPGPDGNDETIYDFIQVRIPGKPDYRKCTKAVIRAYVDIDSEFDLINSYRSYLLGIGTIDDTYEEYLRLLKEVKEKVRKDFPTTQIVG